MYKFTLRIVPKRCGNSTEGIGLKTHDEIGGGQKVIAPFRF